jgi:hypothetical protein
MDAVAARIGSGGWKEFQVADIVPVPRRTTAHDHKQLAEALGWTVVQVDKAIQLGGILPRYELKTPRWKGATVDELVARREELASALDEAALLSVGEMIAALGMQGAEWSRGREHGIIPGPDCGLFWSRALASDLAARSEDLRAQIPRNRSGQTTAPGCSATSPAWTSREMTSWTPPTAGTSTAWTTTRTGRCSTWPPCSASAPPRTGRRP